MVVPNHAPPRASNFRLFKELIWCQRPQKFPKSCTVGTQSAFCCLPYLYRGFWGAIV